MEDLHRGSPDHHVPGVILRLPSIEFFARFIGIFRQIISLGEILGKSYNYDYLKFTVMLLRRIKTVNIQSRT